MAGRIRWAVEGLELTGTERVLEVGPGHGVAIDLCAELLPEGQVVGLDRSPKMVEASHKRYRRHIDEGRAQIFEGTPADSVDVLVRLGPFDRIFALRVRSFLDEPEETLAPLVPLLAPGAEVHLVFDSPSGTGLEEMARRAELVMTEFGLEPGPASPESIEGIGAIRVIGRAAPARGSQVSDARSGT